VLADGPPFRLLPRLDDDNRFFWTSGADGRLRFLRCGACETYVHPPAPVCPRCLTAQPSPEPVSGRAVLESFTVNYQQWIPESEPYMIAWVSIVEQPDVRLTTNLVGVDAESVSIGMEVEVLFEEQGEIYLPLFRPAGTGSGAGSTP